MVAQSLNINTEPPCLRPLPGCPAAATDNYIAAQREWNLKHAEAKALPLRWAGG